MEYEDKDIHFLFEEERWNGSKIKKMANSHIINTLLMLRRRAVEFKLNYELFVIDNMNNNLLIPKDDINELSKKDALNWITKTPIYMALMKELEERKLADYFNIIMERTSITDEK